MICEQASISIKRPDSVIYVKKTSLTENSYIIGPNTYCGHIPLINCAFDEESANCKIIRAAINGKFKIILYTIKSIDIDE